MECRVLNAKRGIPLNFALCTAHFTLGHKSGKRQLTWVSVPKGAAAAVSALGDLQAGGDHLRQLLHMGYDAHMAPSQGERHESLLRLR